MVVGLAFLATAVATLFAQATLVRYTQDHRPQDRAWTIALAMFALASAALATGVSTGWDNGTFRIFFLLGAVLSVPWLALGTVHLLFRPGSGRRAEWVLVFFSGLATGVLLHRADGRTVHGTAIPVGKDVFGVFPRVLAAVGSGVGAVVIIVRRGRLRGALRPVAHDAGQRPPRRRQRADRARHARAVERRADPGHRGQGRGVRAHPRRRDHRDLRRLPRRVRRRRRRRDRAATERSPRRRRASACSVGGRVSSRRSDLARLVARQLVDDVTVVGTL